MLAASSPATGDPIHFNSSHRIFIEQQGSYYGIGLSGKMRVYDVFLRSSKGVQGKRCSINVWLQRSVREMQLGSKQPSAASHNQYYSLSVACSLYSSAQCLVLQGTFTMSQAKDGGASFTK